MKRPWLGAGLILFGVCQVALSQEECGKDPLFQETQRKEAVGDEDNKVIDAWLDCALLALEAAMNPELPPADQARAIKAFVSSFSDFYKKPEVTAAFRDRLAARAAERFAADLAASEKPEPAKVATLQYFAFAMREAAHPALIPAFDKGLTSKVQSIRYYSAAGYRDVLPGLAQDAPAVKAAIAVLQAAGTTETNGVILGEIYRALRIPALIAEVSEAMANIFAARLAQVQTGLIIRDDAELDAYLFLLQQAAQIPDAQKQKIVRAVAVLLKYDVDTRQSNPALNFQQKAAVSKRIKAAEDLLTQLVQPPGKAPSVMEAIKNNGDPFAELAKWIGSAEVEGVLNGAPWSLPRGGEAEAAAPAEPAGGEDKG